MNKNLYNFKAFSWPLVKKPLLELVNIGKKIKKVEENENNIWFLLKRLAPYLEFNEADKEWQQEKTIISLLETDLLESFLSILKPNVKIENIIAPEQLLKQLQTVVAIIAPAKLAPYYSVEEIKKINVSEQKNYNFNKLVYSLYALQFIDKEWPDIIKIALAQLKTKFLKQDKFEWEELVLFTVYTSILYWHFGRLWTAEREFLLENYFYRAVMVGLPVDIVLQQQLLNCEWVVPYIHLNIYYVEELEENKETIFLTGQTDNVLTLGNILKEYGKKVGSEVLVEKNRLQFVNHYYKNNIVNKPPQNWLLQVVTMYSQLKQANLVDWLHLHPLMREEEHEEDLLKLYVYFAFGGLGYKRMVDYFKNSSFITPLDFFLGLSRNVDLTNKVLLEKCFEVIQLLEEQKLLPANQDLIIFHESDNQFHWNESLLK